MPKGMLAMCPEENDKSSPHERRLAMVSVGVAALLLHSALGASSYT